MMAFPFTSRTHYLSDFQSDNRQATKQHKRMAYIQAEELQHLHICFVSPS